MSKQVAKEKSKAEVKVEQGVHNYSGVESYVPPEDPILQQRLEWFQDQKLALMMHWGIYSQLGIIESWPLCDQEMSWSRKQIDWEVTDEEFKQQYWNLNKTFNPVRFDPEVWADLAKEGGFRYCVFTTKHHDGFCMWDTKYSDYKTTAADCPFHTNRHADICKSLFESMRKRGIAIAAYFSKADWHVPTYWAPNMERGAFMSRNPTYDTKEHPELWEQFKQFTQNQIYELGTQYGKIDIMWFDAGWVREAYGQDIGLGEIIDKVRKVQPWLLCADRTVGGPYENYVTPEQTVPDKPLGIPWESCITMGTRFSFNYEDDYKSVRQLVHLLLDIVAKGGNLALNVGPQPDGRLPRGAIERMKGLGAWMRQNGEGVYETRVCEPYRTGDYAFTRRKDGTVYAFRLYQEGEKVEQNILIPYPQRVEKVTFMDGPTSEGCGIPLEFTQTAEGISCTLPAGQLEGNPITHLFKLQ